MFLFFIFVFAVFKLAGWPKRATIARGSQWVPKDSATISLSLRREEGHTHPLTPAFRRNEGALGTRSGSSRTPGSRSSTA